ncbi:MAG: cell division protein FtsA, partial [Acetobacteraceae bacterium]|nr:cell division protein FtsA [Acetobacteraceae bacterium]
MNAPERNDSLITVMDVGSSRVRVLVAEVVDGALRLRGHGSAVAKGMRKG